MTYGIKVSIVHIYLFYYSQGDLYYLNEYYDKTLKSISNYDHDVATDYNFCEVI